MCIFLRVYIILVPLFGHAVNQRHFFTIIALKASLYRNIILCARNRDEFVQLAHMHPLIFKYQLSLPSLHETIYAGNTAEQTI